MIRLKYNLGTGRRLPTEELFPVKGKGCEKGGGFPPASSDY
ncbi:UNVERIFIED_ORG: hypothetical protein M2438_005091 [Methylobacterium sp. SuP10 SLI 274]|nr:hypothetical protein [Methylorubrum extorquens]MDF9866376.1 hypothetical protein [Methylorubrum pseudosasae]MDH6639916.1 hypothetical protein [Methylobacterium sp. SuP10 SLI 274]MDH6669109.1 hypothetical protein [Methylorubrum zatmanii]MCP1560987.1 hypothetical protein [Methylorubrum extorquens]MDF9794666.1 hypothetical protein [Methylorubrum extorquens]